MILLIDTETTGLLSKSADWIAQPGICQIGAVKLDDALVEIDSFYSLVNPEAVKWHEEAIKTHGITPDMVADAPTFFEIGPALARFAVGCDVFAGFNTKFDKNVIWFQLLKYGLEKSFPWPPLDVDVMKLASSLMELQGKRGTKNPKLVDAYERFCGKLLADAHNALVDIRATADVWRAINAEA